MKIDIKQVRDLINRIVHALDDRSKAECDDQKADAFAEAAHITNREVTRWNEANKC